MPTVSQHYGHHAVPGAVDETRTRQQAAPVVLMVSGGADSTALLLMACTSKLDIQDGRGVAPSGVLANSARRSSHRPI